MSGSYLYFHPRPHIIGMWALACDGGSTLGMPEIHLEARSDVSFELETELIRGNHETTLIWTSYRVSPVCGGKREQISRRSLAPGNGKAKPGVCVNLLST